MMSLLVTDISDGCKPLNQRKNNMNQKQKKDQLKNGDGEESGHGFVE